MTIMKPCSSNKRKRSPNEIGDEADQLDHNFRLFRNEDGDEVDDNEDDDEDEEVQLRRKQEYEQILEAQEPTTVEHYDDIKVTPFNLDDEREEGDFDETGNFTFRKESKKDELYDTWAESVDWSSVEKNQREKRPLPSETEKSESPLPVPRDKLACYRQMLRIMRPDETVQRSIKRLGDSIPKRRSGKTKGKSDEANTSSVNITELRCKLDKMIELAHERLEDGEIDIYQKSYDDIEEAIN